MLTLLQNELTNYNLVGIQYINKDGKAPKKLIAPVALLSYENLYLIAFWH